MPEINRLKVVLAEQRVKNKWLSENIGVSQNSVSKWATNTKQPSVETFYKIAILLKVDIRDLFLSTSRYSLGEAEVTITRITSGAKPNINRLKVVLAERKLTNKWLADHLGVKANTVSKWVTNTQQPSVETLYNIAQLIKIDIRDMFNSTQPK